VKITKYFSYVLLALFFGAVQLYPSKCLGENIAVVTSIFPVADMVRAVGAEHVDVTFILPAGASPHTFEPKPSLVKKITGARIFFMIGAGLEFWAEKFVKLAGPGLKTVVLSEKVSLIHTAKDHYEAQHHDGKPNISDRESSFANPHIWLDPGIVKLMFRIKEFVSFHASWDYFARRYGLEPVGVIESAPGRNPTPLQIKNIVDQIKRHNIQAVFAEPQLNPRAAEVIAKETKVKVLLLDPLGGPGIKRRSNYIDLMRYNLNVLQEAMQ